MGERRKARDIAELAGGECSPEAEIAESCLQLVLRDGMGGFRPCQDVRVLTEPGDRGAEFVVDADFRGSPCGCEFEDGAEVEAKSGKLPPRHDHGVWRILTS